MTADRKIWSAEPLPIQFNTPLWGLGRQSSETMLVSNRYTDLLEGQRRTMAVPYAGRRDHVRPVFRCKQQRVQIGLHGFLQPPPLLDGQKHSRFHATLGYNLRLFRGARFEKRTESGLCLQNLSRLAYISPLLSIFLIIYMTTGNR